MSDERALRIAQAREVLDWLEENPSYPLPSEFAPYQGDYGSYLWGSAEKQKAELAESARLLGNCVKVADDNYFGVVKAFPLGASIGVKASREKTCAARVVGRKTVRKNVLVSEAVYEEQDVESDVIEWDCPPILLKGASA